MFMNKSSFSLRSYKKKRDFKKTAEPSGKMAKSSSGHLFVVQKHHARRLHYDLRLEMNGVLKSWAVPKEPVRDPNIKRLAIHVEDHPIEYANFKGTIPKGEYGAGKVEIWDKGKWYNNNTNENPLRSYYKGAIKFKLKGRKLKGNWILVRPKQLNEDAKKEHWLLSYLEE